MKLNKYDRSTGKTASVSDYTANYNANSVSGSNTGGGSGNLDRSLWGNRDTGDDIDESILVNGSLYVFPTEYDDDDNAPERSTFADDEGGNVYVGNTIYIPCPDWYEGATTGELMDIMLLFGNLDSRISDISDTLQALQDKIAADEELLQSLQDLVDYMEDEIGENRRNISAVSNNLETLTNNFTSLQELVYSINDILTDVVNNRLTAINNAISGLQSDCDNLQVTITNLTTEIRNNTESIEELREMLNNGEGGGLTESQVRYIIEGYGYATIDYVNEAIKNVGGGHTDEQINALIQAYLEGHLATVNGNVLYNGGNIQISGGETVDLSDYVTKSELEQLESGILKTLQDLEDMFYVKFDDSTRKLSITIGHPTSIGGEVQDNTYTVTIPCYGESGGGDGGYSEEQIKEWISEAIESLKTDYNLDVTIEHANELYDLYLDRGWPTGGDGSYDDTQLKNQIIRLLTQVATESSLSYNSNTGQLSIRWAYPDEWTNSGDFDISTLTKSVTISTSSGGGDVDLTDVYNRLSALEEHYTSLQTLVYSINDTLTEVVNNRLTEINNSISSLQGDLSSLNATVTNIDAKVTQNTGNITDIYNLVDSLQATISDLQSEQQTLKYGNASNPVVLVSGKLVRASGSSNWTFNGSMKDRITGVSISVNGGSLLVTITASYSLNVNSVQATQALSGATDITSYSIEERNYGAHWFESKVQSTSVTNTVLQIREFHNGNDNNDSWVTNDTVSDGKTIREININVIGYIG